MELITLSEPKVSKAHLNKIISVLRNGGTVVHPTETVYGIAVNIYDQLAVRKLLSIKGRKEDKPLSIMVRDLKVIESIIGVLSDFTRRILNIVFPGPVTVILATHKNTNIPYFSKKNSIGFRISDHYLCRELLDGIDYPIATTSANKSGQGNPQLATEVISDIGNLIDLVVDGGKTQSSIPSTVIDLRNDKIKVLREGIYDIKHLEKKLKYG